MDRCEKKFRNKGEKDFLINFAFVVIYNMSMYRGCECHSHGLQCVKVSGLLDPAPGNGIGRGHLVHDLSLSFIHLVPAWTSLVLNITLSSITCCLLIVGFMNPSCLPTEA